MSNANPPFPRDAHLTAIAIAYKNPDVVLIADQVLPRVTVGLENFDYWEYPEAESYTVPDTRVGEKSTVKRIELSGTKKSSRTEDFGLEIPLTASDVSQAAKGSDPKERATEQATNLMLLDREIRVANLVFDASKYASTNKTDLSASSGAQQFSNASSSPLTTIRTGLDACLVRPNVLCFGHAAWSALSAHPKVVKAALGNESGEGFAPRARVAEILEVQEIIVGSSFFNSVKPGKTPVLARAWGKHMLAFFRDRTVQTSGGLTFGITAQFGSRVAGAREVDMGLRGGTVVRSGESVKELIIAPRAAYFFENAAA